MPDNAIIYLPLNTYVNVRVNTNATLPQQVALVQENGTSNTYQGTGERDTLIGQLSISTPGQSLSSLGYKVVVTAASYQSGSWVPSQISQGSCSVMYYSLAMVVAEDFIDQDWNDAVALFTWWVPPQLRERLPQKP